MEQWAIEYLANACWQLPLLAGGAWLLLRLWKLSPAMQHRVWLGVLVLALLMPLRGILPVAAQAGNAPSASPLTAPIADRLPANGAPTSAQSGIAEANCPSGYIGVLHRIRLNATAIDSILALWLVCVLWGIVRLALAWNAARRLTRGSRQVVLTGHEAAEVLDCARRLGASMPDVRESDAIAGPVVVGAIHPVLLWPLGFRSRSHDEFKAALCHEIAHIRRRDYAMNLLCEAAVLPLRWHPALLGVERRVRATREMACDAMAARVMESESLYATCLLSLAQSIVGVPAEHSLAAGLFHGNVMEERMMRLMRNNVPTTWRARLIRGLAGAAAITAAIALAAAFHVVPAMAQTVAPPPPPLMAAAPAPPVVNPVVHLAPVTPITQVAPATPATPTPPEAPAHHTESSTHKPIVILDGQFRGLTPAQRARLNRQLEQAQRKVAAATARINSPEFRQQIAEAQRKALRAETMLNSAEFQQQMADAQKQVAEATTKINSPEFQKQIQDANQASTKVNNAEFKKQMADAQKQVAEATTKINSLEFRKQIEDQMRAAENVNSAEIQKQIADARKEVAEALAKMKAGQKGESTK